jgi:Flp pilus assembly pilin Flp
VENRETHIDKDLSQRASLSPPSFSSVLLSQGTDSGPGGEQMYKLIDRLWSEDVGQDIAEYAVMLAVILVLVVGTVRLIGSNANTVFSSAASSIQ